MPDLAFACTPVPVNPGSFNQNSRLPYGLQINQLHQAMNDFLDFLGLVNKQPLLKRDTPPRMSSYASDLQQSSWRVYRLQDSLLLHTTGKESTPQRAPGPGSKREFSRTMPFFTGTRA